MACNYNISAGNARIVAPSPDKFYSTAFPRGRVECLEYLSHHPPSTNSWLRCCLTRRMDCLIRKRNAEAALPLRHSIVRSVVLGVVLVVLIFGWLSWRDISSRPRQLSEFPPPEKLVQVQLCSVSNQLATSDCQAAGTTYQISLPQSMCPQQSCSVHQGRLLNPDEEPGRNEGNFPQRFFRSLRNLFGR